jgi:TPP-dependent pyruvate/acetoin dehydrogenase alpha subunit
MVRQTDATRTPAIKPFSLISDAKLKQLYTTMLTCRLVDERLRHLHRSPKSRYIPSSGYEAAMVGAAIDLRREDWLLPGRHEAIGCLLKGESLAALLSPPVLSPPVLSPTVSSRPDSSPPVLSPSEVSLPNRPALHVLPSDGPPDRSIDAQLDIAIGLALAARAGKKGGIVMVFTQAATATSRLRHSLQFAAERRLPLLILLLHSHPRTPESPRKKSPANAFLAAANAAAIPIIPVDESDAIAMYRVAYESIHKGRHDAGPSLMEAATWRLPSKPRAPLVEDQLDPIAKMETYLTGKGLPPVRWKQAAIDRLMRQTRQQTAGPIPAK